MHRALFNDLEHIVVGGVLAGLATFGAVVFGETHMYSPWDRHHWISEAEGGRSMMMREAFLEKDKMV